MITGLKRFQTNVSLSFLAYFLIVPVKKFSWVAGTFSDVVDRAWRAGRHQGVEAAWAWAA
jgi:hypothetical protein